MFKAEVTIGYIGLGLIQFNCIPAIIQALKTGQSTPVSGVCIMIVGLACFLYNSYKTGNTLYTVANGTGLLGNLVLLVALLIK